jgi:hypothetical protein
MFITSLVRVEFLGVFRICPNGERVQVTEEVRNLPGTVAVVYSDDSTGPADGDGTGAVAAMVAVLAG